MQTKHLMRNYKTPIGVSFTLKVSSARPMIHPGNGDECGHYSQSRHVYVYILIQRYSQAFYPTTYEIYFIHDTLKFFLESPFFFTQLKNRYLIFIKLF